MLFCCWPNVGQNRTGQSRTKHFKLAKVGLAKVEIGQSRTKPWPKSELAKVGRARFVRRTADTVAIQCTLARSLPKSGRSPVQPSGHLEDFLVLTLDTRCTGTCFKHLQLTIGL